MEILSKGPSFFPSHLLPLVQNTSQTVLSTHIAPTHDCSLSLVVSVFWPYSSHPEFCSTTEKLKMDVVRGNKQALKSVP